MKQVVLTGPREAGKTTFCLDLASRAEQEGYSVCGILTLTERGVRLTARDLDGQSERELAIYNHPGTTGNLKTRRWDFRPETLEWGNRQIQKASPSDLFILDEAGILEFKKNGGWTGGMERMDRSRDRLSVIVVRPELTDQALARWPSAELFEIDPSRREKSALLTEKLILLLQSL